MSNAYIQLVQSQLVPLLIKDQTRKFCRFRVTSNATCVGKNLLAEFALAFYTPLPPEKFQIRDMLRYSRSDWQNLHFFVFNKTLGFGGK